jgi:hypothetical protein
MSSEQSSRSREDIANVSIQISATVSTGLLKKHRYYEWFLAEMENDPLMSGVTFPQMDGTILQVMCTLRILACGRMKIPMLP